MNILAIESSCDETAVAIVRDGREVLTDCISSQVELHKLYGGVVPEIASRKHIEAIYGLADQALEQAQLTRGDIDAVAVTYAPGLIGAVLVGVNFAKLAALGLGVPLVPVHHIRGHIAANYLAFPELEPPFLALAISGGNTLIVDVRDYTDMEILGATRDDAAGECFDKAARVLGLPYPGGKPMDLLAQQSPGGKYVLPRAHVDGAELDVSFSGLKTAVVNLAHNAQQKGEELDAEEYAARVAPGQLADAYEAALCMLDRSAKTAWQIENSLRQKGFVPAVRESVTERLRENRLIDDALFARRMVEAGQRAGTGLFALKQKMRAKGIAEEVAEEALTAIGEGEVLDALRRCQPDTLTPIEAMSLIYEWKQKLN